jgi:signal transduction histidine kinase/ActR/RegA family two-component response regulator
MTSTSPTSDPLSQPLAIQLRIEQIRLLCRSSVMVVRSQLASGVFVCWLLSHEYGYSRLAWWFALLVVTTIVRDRIQARYLALGDQATLDRWPNVILLGIAVNGFAWSLPGTVFTPSDPAMRVVISLYLVGLSAVAMTSLASMRHAYTSFLVPFMLPTAVSFFSLDETFVKAGIGICLFVAAMVTTGYILTARMEEMLRLQLENKALAERAQSENSIVERTNRDLALQIQERKRTEAELLIAKSAAELASRAKSQFLANMSHELRTPLNAILGMADLLLRSVRDPRQLKQLNVVRNGGHRLLTIVTDILDLSRIEAGTMRFESVAFSPRIVLNDVTDLLRELAMRKGLRLLVHVDPDVPDQVLGDPHRVKQILSNLIDNGIKFTDAGSVQINLSRVSDLPLNTDLRRTQLRWSVTDSGIGIPASSRSRLFQPFSQVDDSSTRRFGGTGLGLAICRQFVSALGGRIDVASQTGRGSTFWFELPFEPIEESDHAKQALATGRYLRIDGRVLIVEDNDVNRELIAEMLQGSGCSTAVAENGVAALMLLEREVFDLVLMDIHMPGMDGLAATRHIRDREGDDGFRMPIVALTASVMPEDREACAAAGMDDFLGKPFTYADLASVLQRWLRPARAAEA